MKKRLLCLFLIISLFISLIACDDVPVKDDRANVESFIISAEYTIVRSAEYRNSSDIAESIQYLKDAFEQSVGSKLLLDSDTSVSVAERYEIILGDTVREQSKRALETLGINDYTYLVESEKSIIICGGSSAATFEGVKKFCSDILGYEAGSAASSDEIKIEVGSTYTYSESYLYEELIIDGIDINDFVVAYSEKNYFNEAESVQVAMGAYTGARLPLVTFSELTGEEKGVICINASGRDGKGGLSFDFAGYKVTPPINEDGKVTCAVFASSGSYGKAVTAMIEKADAQKLEARLELSLSDDMLTEYSFDGMPIPEWIFQYDTGETKVADGVTYTAMYYKDRAGLPYKAFVLTIDPSKAYLYMGTANDEYDTTPDERQSVEGHMKSAVANGYNVVAGVNGDYFAISGDYHPTGLTIKEGQLLNTSGRPFCAFTYDGRMVIGENGGFVDLSQFRTAVGGSHMIVKDGMPYQMAMDQSHGNTSHPRTLAGVKADGTMILAVIDGRRPTHSNGATLAECARFMLSLGAVDAINLDGGGSSTLITKQGALYLTRNKPSDGGLRRVYDSLLVVMKEEE